MATRPPTAASLAERELVLSLNGVFRSPEERERYLADGWTRMQIVLELLGELPGAPGRRVLELGANPYVFTALLQRRFQYDLELANYFGDAMAPGRHTHVAELAGRPVSFPFAHFNVETDPFPYPDASFDGVLFCEILEHLLVGPDQALAEMRRVTRPGGFLVVSTPNIARLTNLYFLARGWNILDGYSPNGPYGRHNREYTLPEVRQLLDRHGFDTVREDVRNVQPLARRFTWMQKLRPTVWYEHLFVIGRRRP